jgi:hypothetical protein
MIGIVRGVCATVKRWRNATMALRWTAAGTTHRSTAGGLARFESTHAGGFRLAGICRSGALFTYGPHLTSSLQRLAYYVDRILKGARPAHRQSSSRPNSS